MRVNANRDTGLQGHYAGIVTRAGAFLLDIAVVVLLFAVTGQALDYLVSAVFDADFGLKTTAVLPDVLLALWGLLYFSYPVAIGGRTLGMAVLGLKVVRADGSDVDGWHALARAVTLPLSFVFAGIGLLLILLRRDRRALHDLIASTSVVYSWDARSAKLRVLAKQPGRERVPAAQVESEAAG